MRFSLHIEVAPERMRASAVIGISPFFDNVVNASAFGGEVVRPRGETPRALPVIHDVESMAAMEVPGPEAGLWGTSIRWWRAIQDFARDTEVTVGGMPGRVEAGPLSIGGEGPRMVAIDPAGTDFYGWQAEYPAECRAFLSRITDGMIGAERHFRRIDPRPRSPYGVAEDSAQAMSAQMFRDFCIPFDERLYAAFGAGLPDGRGMHMCGQSAHLHAALTDELHITSFNVFGHPVTPATAAKNPGGRCRLWGNVNPMLMLNGTPAEVREASSECLRALAPFGGFTLGDGANVCPGTPVENINALVDAAESYGSPGRD